MGNAAEGGLYDCLACDKTLKGDKALSQHLDSSIAQTQNNQSPEMPKSTLLIYYLTLQPASPVLTPHLPRSLPLTQTNTPSPPPTMSATTPSSSASASSCTSSSFTVTPLNTTSYRQIMVPDHFLQSFSWEAQSPSSALSSFLQFALLQRLPQVH